MRVLLCGVSRPGESEGCCGLRGLTEMILLPGFGIGAWRANLVVIFFSTIVTRHRLSPFRLRPPIYLHFHRNFYRRSLRLLSMCPLPHASTAPIRYAAQILRTLSSPKLNPLHQRHKTRRPTHPRRSRLGIPRRPAIRSCPIRWTSSR